MIGKQVLAFGKSEKSEFINSGIFAASSGGRKGRHHIGRFTPDRERSHVWLAYSYIYTPTADLSTAVLSTCRLMYVCCQPVYLFPSVCLLSTCLPTDISICVSYMSNCLPVCKVANHDHIFKFRYLCKFTDGLSTADLTTKFVVPVECWPVYCWPVYCIHIYLYFSVGLLPTCLLLTYLHGSVRMAERLALPTSVHGVTVGIPLEARFFPNLNGTSLHRAFHVHPSIVSKWLKYCWRDIKP